MVKKGNSYYSDWFTINGKRHRKAHTTELAAQRHQNLMRRGNSSPQAGARSAKPSRPSSPRPTIHAVATATLPPKPSSPRHPKPHSPISERPTSTGRAKNGSTSRRGPGTTATALSATSSPNSKGRARLRSCKP